MAEETIFSKIIRRGDPAGYCLSGEFVDRFSRHLGRRSTHILINECSDSYRRRYQLNTSWVLGRMMTVAAKIATKACRRWLAG